MSETKSTSPVLISGIVILVIVIVIIIIVPTVLFTQKTKKENENKPDPIYTPQTLDEPSYDIIKNVEGKSNEFVGSRFNEVKKVLLALPKEIIEPINLAEVNIYDGNGSLIPASDMDITMSTILQNYPASNFVDGNLGTFGHTQNWDKKTITFTFNTLKTISKIEIYNRADSCCRYRINKLTVTLIGVNDKILSISDPINYADIPGPYLYTYNFPS